MTMRVREQLARMVALDATQFEIRSADSGDDHSIGTLVGYAAVYGQPTVIDNTLEGRFEETLMHGTFRNWLRDHSDSVRCIYEHGLDPSVGLKPIGKPRAMVEDDYGLRVEVPIDDTTYNRDLIASLRSGALDGLSVRMSVTRDDWTTRNGMDIRTIKEAKLSEFSVTSIPAYKAAVAGLRSSTDYVRWQRGGGDTDAPTPPADDSARRRQSTLERVANTMGALRN